MATPTVFNAVATNPGGTGSTITVTLSTHAVGDLLIIYVGNTGNTLWTGNPTGWNRIDQRTVGTSSNGLVGTWLWRKVVSGDTLPLANPVCTLGATVTRAATCRTVRGADLESPFVTSNYGARGFGVGTANPVRPPAIFTPAPEVLALMCYAQRAATNAPDPSGYTADAEVVISGTLVVNAASQAIADQNTSLTNQDSSPTSGARWVAGIICVPSKDYAYYRAGSQATTASGTSVTPTKPTGTTNSDTRGNKDVMIATVEGAGSTTLSAQDTGLWTEIGGVWSGTTSGGGSSVKKFWCHATAAPNMQFNRTGTGEISACITTYYNCHQTNPIGVFDADARASSSTPSWDAITRGSTRSVVTATCVADATPTFTFPGGWTERMDGLGIGCGDQTYNATGSSASATVGLSAGNPTLIGLLEVIGIASTTLVTVTPASVSLSLSSSAPKLITAVTPSASALALTTFAPVVTAGGGETVVTPAAATLTTTTAAPSLQLSVTPPSQSLTATAFAPQLRTLLTPASTSLLLTAFAPSVTVMVTVLSASLNLATFAPTVTATASVVVIPATATLTLSSFAASLQETVTPAAQLLALTTTEPSLALTITPAAASLSLSTFAPSLHETLTPSAPALSLATFTPDITISADVTVQPPSATLVTTGFAPALHEQLTPAASVLSVAAFAPEITVSADKLVQPLSVLLALQNFAPSLQITLIPATAGLSLTANAPTLMLAVRPANALLTLSTFAPSLVVGGDTTVSPASVSLTLTTFAPVITAAVIPTPPRRTFVVKSEPRMAVVAPDFRSYKVAI